MSLGAACIFCSVADMFPFQLALGLVGVALLVGPLALDRSIPVPWVELSAEQRRRLVLIRLLAKLQRARAAVGLDQTIPGPLLEELEHYAVIWETIEHLLVGRQWRAQPELRDRAEASAFESMLGILINTLGPVQQANDPNEDDALMPFGSGVSELEQTKQKLTGLRQLVAAASNALLSYQRPSEESAGMPASSAFPEIQALQEVV